MATDDRLMRESQLRFEETAELLPGIICESDLSLRLTYLNKKGIETFGFSEEEYRAGIYIDRYILETDRKRASEDLANVLKGNFGNPAEYRLRRKDGSFIDLLVNTAPIMRDGEARGLRYCIIDISDRKKAESELRESEERFRRIFDQSLIGIALCDFRGLIYQMNNSFSALFELSGLEKPTLDALVLFDLFPMPDHEKRMMERGCALRGEGWLHRFRASAEASGAGRYYEWSLSPFASDSGEARTFIVQVQDITERKAAQDSALRKAHETAKKAEAAVAGLRRELLRRSTCHSVFSRSPEMQRIFSILPEMARSLATVLILGESGTGKELIARALHDQSPRKAKPFITVNCGALPDALLESELFGYKAGAFTDAKKDKPGKFSLAEGGTLFLDEIGDISAAMQVKLLRFLQEKTFEPLGAAASEKADVRVIAATHRDLPAMVKSQEFRHDLYYRINVLSVTLPPLRRRRCDIPLLCDHFIALFNRRYGKEIALVSNDALNRLLAHDFPGNIRELENIIEHAFVMCGEAVIQMHHLPGALGGATGAGEAAAPGLSGFGSFRELEKSFLEKILAESGGSRRTAARRLGIDPSTLFRKMKRLGID